MAMSSQRCCGVRARRGLLRDPEHDLSLVKVDGGQDPLLGRSIEGRSQNGNCASSGP
jgi:hypothetical protein